MKTPTPIYLSTRRVAQLDGVEKHVVDMSLQRKGHYKGVVPKKLANGHYAWPAAEVYAALGLFDESKRPAAQGLQDRIIEATGADLLATHRVTGWLFETSRDALTAREAIDEMQADSVDVVALFSAYVSRLGFALKHEDDLTPADIEKNRRLALELDRQLCTAIRFLQWRSVASATEASK